MSTGCRVFTHDVEVQRDTSPEIAVCVVMYVCNAAYKI